MAELLQKNTLVCASLENQYVKVRFISQIVSVYQLNLKKPLCYVNKSGEANYHYRLLLTTENDAIMKRSFL